MDSGSNSDRDISIIRPDIKAYIRPSMVLLIYLDKNKYVIKAPRGSDMADIVV